MTLAADFPIDAQYAFVPQGRGRTHVHRAGPEHAPMVVMVSGATLPMGVWGPLVAPLLAAGLQPVRYDLPGRGRTPLDGLGADFESHLAQLDGLLAALAPQRRVHLAGLASGALVVAAYAVRHPDRVAHATLVAPDGTATRFTLNERLLSTPGVGEWLFRRRGRRTLLARAPRYSSRADVQAFVTELLRFALGEPDFHAAVLATVRSFPLHGGEEHYRRLAASGVPTQIVWGREDRITPSAEAAPQLALAFGTAALHLMDGVGHLPFVEQPQTVADLIADALGRNPD